MKPLLDILDQSLLAVIRSVGEDADASGRLKNLIVVAATKSRGNVHFQQTNDALPIFVAYRSLSGRFAVLLTADTPTADGTGPSNYKMPPTQ